MARSIHSIIIYMVNYKSQRLEKRRYASQELLEFVIHALKIWADPKLSTTLEEACDKAVKSQRAVEKKLHKLTPLPKNYTDILAEILAMFFFLTSGDKATVESTIQKLESSV